MGSLPKTVYDGLFTYTGKNIWPQIREGANNFNSLVLTGRPHFRCGTWDFGFNFMTDPDLQQRFGMLDRSGFCANGFDLFRDQKNIPMVAGFITESDNATSPFSSYFRDLKTAALQQENDRIRIGIQGAMNRIKTTDTKEPMMAALEFYQHEELAQTSGAAPSATPFFSSVTSWLRSSKESIDGYVHQSLITKPATKLGSLLGYYFDGLCQMIGECETYFPSSNRNLWSNGGNPNTLFNSASLTNNVSNVAAPILPPVGIPQLA